MLLMQLVDLFWLIGPDLVGHGHGHVPLRVHWMDLAAVLGLGGLWLFLFARQAAGRARCCRWASRRCARSLAAAPAEAH